MNEDTFIPLWRSFQQNVLWQEPRVFSKAEAWLDIILNVQYGADVQEHVFGMVAITTTRGQSIRSLTTWGKRWGWSKNKVRRFFGLLEKLEMLKVENVQKTTRITVVNYVRYAISRTHTKRTRNAHETQAGSELQREQRNKVNKENVSSSKREILDSLKAIIDRGTGGDIAKQKLKVEYDILMSWAIGKGLTPADVAATLSDPAAEKTGRLLTSAREVQFAWGDIRKAIATRPDEASIKEAEARYAP